MGLDTVNLEELIREQRIFSVFQPLVSMKRKAVFGFEALSLALRPGPARWVLPLDAGLSKFTTEPYISLASGTLCMTISAVFK